MRRQQQLHHALLARRAQRLHVAVEHRLERLRRLPFRVLRRQGLHPGECEGELEVDRLLRPERAVVVERRDALLRRHEPGVGTIGDFLDERDNALFGSPVVPRRQRRVRLSPDERGHQKDERGHQKKENQTGRGPDSSSTRHAETLPREHAHNNSDLGPMKARNACFASGRTVECGRNSPGRSPCA
jgi:hypothetical protein